MVRFEDKKLVIEIYASDKATAIEKWQELHGALCDMLHNVNQDNIYDDRYYLIPELINNLMPNFDTALKMKD